MNQQSFTNTYTNDQGHQVTDILQPYSEEQQQEAEINKANASLVFTPEFVPYYFKEVWHFKLSPQEAIVYGFIRFFVLNSKGRFYFSDEDIAQIFRSTPNSINNTIAKLKKVGAIETRTKVKSGGGTIRFVTRVHQVVDSESTIRLTENPSNGGFLLNKNKINKNKINKEKINKKESFSSLKDLSESHLQEIADAYQVPVSFVISKLDDLKNYCEGNGRRYKNYYSTLKAWVKKDAIRRREVSNHGSRIVVAG